MNLSAMIQQYRLAANDAVEPYFVSDEALTVLLNEAVHEAAVRGRLIHESSDPDLCQIELVPGVAVYPLHAALYELTHISYCRDDASRRRAIALKSTEELDRITPEWRERSGEPLYAVQDDTSLRLVPRPEYAGDLQLEGYRLPLEDMALDDKDTATPEINQAHHRHLYQWALYRVFSIPDTETFDPKRADAAEQEFTRYFGQRPDADLRRITREDEPHNVKGYWV